MIIFFAEFDSFCDLVAMQVLHPFLLVCFSVIEDCLDSSIALNVLYDMY
jgi:hypothetical protein